MTAMHTDEREGFERYIVLNAIEILVSNIAAFAEEEFDESVLGDGFRVEGSVHLLTDLFPEEDEDAHSVPQQMARLESHLLVAQMAYRLAESSDDLREIGDRLIGSARRQMGELSRA